MSRTGTFISIGQSQEGAEPSIVTPNNPFPVYSYGLDVARGLIDGAYGYSVFGELTTDGGVTDAVIWESGMPSRLTVPDNIQLSIVSSSASDTGQITIRYLDGDLIQQVETVTLTGTSPVLTTADDIRAINNAFSKSGPLVGNVSMTSGGVTYAYIPAGSIQFNTSMQRVPAGKRFIITAMYAGSSSGSADASCVVKMETTFINGDSFADDGYLHPLGAVAIQDNSAMLSLSSPMAIPGGEWVGFTVSCDKAATITAGAFGWIEVL